MSELQSRSDGGAPTSVRISGPGCTWGQPGLERQTRRLISPSIRGGAASTAIAHPVFQPRNKRCSAMDFLDHLQTLSVRAEQAGESLTNEEATKMALIAPFIQALGYDIFNPNEVKPEFSADLPGIKQGERVDYAVLENGVPKILVEAKPYRTDLRTAEKGQLSRYFQATHARIGVLSNGRTFLFFSDLDRPNLMDEKPFAEIDLFDLKAAPLEQIKQLSKSMFDIDTLLSTAERLKYLRGAKEEIKQELSDPSEWLVREMARRVHSAERVSGQLVEKFKPIVADAVKAYINDRINERLSTAMEVEKAPSIAGPAEEGAEEEAAAGPLEFTEGPKTAKPSGGDPRVALFIPRLRYTA